MSGYDRIAHWFDEGRGTTTYGLDWLRRAVELLDPAVPRRACDLGCGSGRPLLRALLDLGFAVDGVDASAGMLALARTHCPEARLTLGELDEHVGEPPYGLMLAWDSVFHLPPARQRRAFDRAAALLAPGGVLLATVGGVDGTVSSCMQGVEFHHWSLAAEDYHALLQRHGLTIIHSVRDQGSDYHLVLIAKR